MADSKPSDKSSTSAATASAKSSKQPAPDLPVKVQVTAVTAVKASQAGTEADVSAGQTFEVDEAEAYRLRDEGKVRISGMHPADSEAAKEAARKEKANDANTDATRFGNREGQSPPNDQGAPNANAAEEAFESTDTLRKAKPAGVGETGKGTEAHGEVAAPISRGSAAARPSGSGSSGSGTAPKSGR